MGAFAFGPPGRHVWFARSPGSSGPEGRPNCWLGPQDASASGFDRHGDAGNHGRKGLAVDGAGELEIELPQVVWGFARIEGHVEDDSPLTREAGIAHPRPLSSPWPKSISESLTV